MPDPNDPLDLVGTTVAEKYSVESVVGEGGFAIVYRATHLLWKRPVALKVFNALFDAPVETREKLRDDFVREGALLAELSEQSAAICQARDVGMLNVRGRDVPFMVLEWLEGASLDAVLVDEVARNLPPRSLEATMALIEPAALALGLAHARGIAHRDVKPANVFVVGDPRAERPTVKLLDFGIAKVVQDAEKTGGAFAKTRGELTSFTPAYGAPEQFARSYGATGPWTDVFALALVVAEVLTGKAPLDGDTLSQIAFASTNEMRRPTPRSMGALVTDEVEAVFARAVAVKPTDRYPDAGAFWSALRAAASSNARVASSGALRAVAPTSTRSALESARTVAAVAGAVPLEAPAAAVTGTPVAAPASPPNRTPFFLVGAAGIAGIALGAYFFAGGRAGRPGGRAHVPPSASVTAAPSQAPSAEAPRPRQCPQGMVFVPGGSFFMGDDEGEAAEKPAHQVVLSPFCIDRLEVTTAEYKRCSDAGECLRASQMNEWEGITRHDHDAYDPLCNARDPKTRGRHPINCIDHAMAASYCHFAEARLPSEAEWEFSARGKDGRRYPWGEEAPTGGHLNACGPECVAWGKSHGVSFDEMFPMDDGFATTAPVGSFPAGKTIWGVEDMVGNVWEWVSDGYAPYRAGDVGHPLKDPRGPEDAGARMSDRVIRGGAWNSEKASWLRPSFRFHAPATMKSHGIGFRCARDAKSE